MCERTAATYVLVQNEYKFCHIAEAFIIIKKKV